LLKPRRLPGSGIDHPAPCALERQRRKSAGSIRAGIHADPVLAEFDAVFVNRMAMYDDSAMIGVAGEKRLAYPKKIGRALAAKRRAGPDAGMYEEIIAHPHAQRKPGEPLPDRQRDGLARDGDHPPAIVRIDQAVGHTEAVQCRRSTMLQPEVHRIVVASQGIRQRCLVIATNDVAILGGDMPMHRSQQPGGIGTPIDQVAQENELRSGRTATRIVLLDFVQEIGQEIRTSMDIADRIDTAPFWYRGSVSAPCRPSSKETHTHILPKTRGSWIEVQQLGTRSQSTGVYQPLIAVQIDSITTPTLKRAIHDPTAAIPSATPRSRIDG